MLKKEEIDFVQKIMSDLDKKKISIPFQKPVDPDRDNCPDYFEVIKNPMCIDVVKQKLSAGQYITFTDWINDIDLIWNNAQNYNSKYSPIFLMAKDIQLWFWKKLETAPKNEDSNWLSDINTLTKKIQTLLSS